MIRIARVEPIVLRAPIAAPVPTSFGVMRDRPALLVRAEDVDGAVGWGEAWCNFPACGAEHRARLIETILAPLVTEAPFEDPPAMWRKLTEATRVLALQAGEPGPLAQAIAGIDIALWDLAARRAGEPLWRLLGGRAGVAVNVYASGINPDGAVESALRQRGAGHRAFKLKLGFGQARDLANLRALRDALGAAAPIMTDANQAWGVDEAVAMGRALAAFDPAWLEEPVAADHPAEDWARLTHEQPVPLAAGENLRGDATYDAAIAAGHLAVIQPDSGKWGGFSAGLPLARRIVAAGRRFCPHWLGGGIGLIAAAQLLAAAGNDDYLEVDSNPNPLRDVLVQLPPVIEGRMALPEGPGLGVVPDAALIERFCAQKA